MNRSSSIRRLSRFGYDLGGVDGQTLWSIAAVFAAVFLGALDQTVIVTVLPAVVVDLQIPFNHLDQAAWIVSGYLLGYTISLPLMGQFADLRGRRLAFGAALTAFAVGSAGCALAGSLGVLIGARVLQAAGGGALLPVAVAIVSDRFPSSRRVLLIGLVGAIAEAGGVLGPLYGAAIVNLATWRWIFWLNLPFAVICLFVTLRGLTDRERPGARLDLLGAVLAALALGCLIAGLSHEPIPVASFDARSLLVALSVALLVGFLVQETRASPPLIDLRLFTSRAFSAATVGAFVLGVTLIVAMVDVPLYAATVLNVTPADGGLLLMRLTAFIPVGAILGGALALRWGLGPPSALGFVIASCGLAAMSGWGSTPNSATEWLALAIGGLGFGLLIAPLTTAVVNVGGNDRSASAASTFTVARLTGMTAGLSILTTWGLTRFDDLAGALPLPLPTVGESTAAYQTRLASFNQALVEAGAEVYHEIFLAAAIFCVVGVVAGVLLWSAGGRGQATGGNW